MRFSHPPARPFIVAAIAAIAAMLAHAAMAAPIAVRFPEGITHGFLALRTTEGKTIAVGDLLQLPRGGTVESRLVMRFRDGSLHDETVVFSQETVFRMLSYRIVQKGPSFPFEIEASVDRSGSYTVISKKPKEDQETDKGKLDLPPDVYNGMITNMVKNLAGGRKETVHVIAFQPKPRVIELELVPVGKTKVSLEGVSVTVAEYAIKPDLGGLLDSIASLVGKHPPDFHCWITDDDVPAFVRFEGPFYFKTPIWRIDLVAPEWGK